jgi:hypothetical protein
MKIKSRFKDYYDYIAHLYGGGDERVTYVRDRIPEDLTSVTFARDEIKHNLVLYEPRVRLGKGSISWLVVNGKVYTLFTERNDDYSNKPTKLLTQENFGGREGELFQYASLNWPKYQGFESHWAEAISRKIKQPVFVIDHYSYGYSSGTTTFVIEENIPILQNFHFAKYASPEQLYQEIAYYISNKMVDSPDLVVNNNMTDKEKIVQHGFDYRQSFRHRK